MPAEAYFELTADIVFDEKDDVDWKPIGDSVHPFKGTFIGNGHKIKNLTVDRSGENYVGMFGYVDGGTIENVVLEDVDVKGNWYVGGLAGHLSGGAISSISVTGSVEGVDRVGALVGWNHGGKVIASYVKANESLEPCGDNTDGATCEATEFPEMDMQKRETYRNDRWNFEKVWAIDEGESTPYLRQVTMKSVPLPGNVNALAGTAFEKLPLPKNAGVLAGHLLDVVRTVEVDWQSENYQPAKAGTQRVYVQPVLTGEYEGYEIVGPNVFTALVNLEPLAVPVIVEVQPGEGEAVITWNAVDGAESYAVYQKSAAGWVNVKNGIPHHPDPGTNTMTTTIQNLANGGTYTFAVTARRGEYESELSAPKDVTLPAARAVYGDGDDVDDDDEARSETGYVARVEKTADPQTGKITATVALDEKRLADLARTQPGATVPVIVDDAADRYGIPLSGSLIQAMAEGGLALDIRTPAGNCTLPVAAMDVAQLAAVLGASDGLAGVRFQVSISFADADTVARLEAAAAQGGFAIVVPPVEFAITATYNGKTVAVGRFNAFVQREIPIPAGVDPNRVTTAVAMDETGNIRHVPTAVVERDGRYYAVIRSLTNSAYALIRHSKTFADVRGHWAQGVVQDLASRLVVRGVDARRFAPDRPISREQFAALLIRALGLPEQADLSPGTPFKDVPAHAWYAGAVAQAKQYGLITGYQDGTFRPGKPINRLEAFVMLSRAMKLAGLPAERASAEAEVVLSRFADAREVPVWARPAVAAAVQTGLVQGSGGKLLPHKAITRAETAAVLHRMLVQAGFIYGVRN